MNTQQRMDYIRNHDKYIIKYMALHDEEVKQRKKTKTFYFIGT